MESGTVKVFDEKKGFGFITADYGEEIFVHISGLEDAIKANDKVIFEIERGKKGKNAVRVKLATEPAK